MIVCTLFSYLVEVIVKTKYICSNRCNVGLWKHFSRTLAVTIINIIGINGISFLPHIIPSNRETFSSYVFRQTELLVGTRTQFKTDYRWENCYVIHRITTVHAYLMGRFILTYLDYYSISIL